MAERTAIDLHVDAVMQRLGEDLVNARGQRAEPKEVERVVRAKAQTLSDAPLQEFVNLLIEHQARDELRERGLRRDLGAVDEASGEVAEADGADLHAAREPSAGAAAE